MTLVSVMLILYIITICSASQEHTKTVDIDIPRDTNSDILQIYTDVTIVVSSKSEDTTWVNDNLNMYEISIYTPNNPSARHTTDYDKGFEVCMYLTYIINNYDKLSNHTVFLHGHRSSWHSRDITTIIPRLDWLNIEYANLNVNYFQRHSISRDPYTYRFYKEVYEPVFGIIPPYINSYCCAQFAVSRTRIRSVPLSSYIALDQWLRHTNMPCTQSGRAFEYVWSHILGERYDATPYPNGLCSIITCTSEEYSDVNMNFRLQYTPSNIFYVKQQ